MNYARSRDCFPKRPTATTLWRCAIVATLALPQESVFAVNPLPPEAKAALGVQSMASYEGSPEFFAAEFIKRGLPQASGHGWLVVAVNPENAGGIKVSDIITSIDGIAVRNQAAKLRVYKKLEVGKECKIELRRVTENGKSWKTVKVTAIPIDRKVADKYWAELEAMQPAGEEQSPAVE